MKHTQTLESGLTIRQDIGDAVRAAFFQTQFEEWLYATDGGTLFIVRYRGRLFGLTCRHVFGSFRVADMFITSEKFGQKGSKPAPIKGYYHPSSPSDGAVGTDVTDIVVIEFSDDIASNFFKGTEYVIDSRTWTRGQKGHVLRVQGALKEKSIIDPPDITIGFCNLELQDNGAYPLDPFLRRAIAKFERSDFKNITGISGSPVYDETANALCGIVVRGGITAEECSILYFDMSDVIRILDAARTGVLTNNQYQKTISPLDLSQPMKP